MTSILPISDLHIEFMPGKPDLRTHPKVAGFFRHQADIVVCAGDMHPGTVGLTWLRRQYPDSEIVVVAGNHDFWSRNHKRHIDRLYNKARSLDIHFLENDTTIIHGVKFIGATLWSDYNLLGDPDKAMEDAMQMNDYRRIRIADGRAKITPQYLLSVHQKSRAFIEEQLEGSSEKKYVVTHHAPSSLSLDMSKDREIQPCYASNLDEMISRKGPAYWHHGHLHNSSNYLIGNTRVICNPFGYWPDDLNPLYGELLLHV